MTQTLEVGFSSCPNDTFMFHGLVAGEVVIPGIRLVPAMADIEALNLRALGESALPPLPVTKLSAAALGLVADRYAVLGSGAALGRGCGPLVVRRSADGPRQLSDLAGCSVAIPGQRTTAHLLLRMFSPGAHVTAMRFDRIMPAVAAGEFDAGLIIHESRFTYADHGLVEVADLGDVWERATDMPLPLGVVVADRALGSPTCALVETALRASVELAFAEPERVRPYVRGHAHELSDEVCDRHIGLYVNEFSVDLGRQGRAAIEELLRRARTAGFTPESVRSPWIG